MFHVRTRTGWRMWQSFASAAWLGTSYIWTLTEKARFSTSCSGKRQPKVPRLLEDLASARLRAQKWGKLLQMLCRMKQFVFTSLLTKLNLLYRSQPTQSQTNPNSNLQREAHMFYLKPRKVRKVKSILTSAGSWMLLALSLAVKAGATRMTQIRSGLTSARMRAIINPQSMNMKEIMSKSHQVS